MELFDIAPGDIDVADDRFRISRHFDRDRLLLSIDKIGLVSPLVVVEREDSRFVLVSGWKRILACLELSLPQVPVFRLEEDDDSRAFLFALYENASIRNFDILEKAEIVQKLVGFEEDEKKIVRQFFPLLDIPSTLSYLDHYLKIARLDPSWKKVVFDKKMPLPSVLLLAEFTPREREQILPLVLPLGSNKLKQFLEDLFELSRKTGDPVEAILTSPGIKTVSNTDYLTPLQKADRVRRLLRERRYPTLSPWKKTFDASVRKARLSGETTFDAPSFFEDGEFSVTFSLKDKKDFQKRLAKLQELASDENLFSMVKRFFDA